MKKTVKVLALLMALLMMATAFTACNQKSEVKDDKEEKTEATDNKEDKKAVEKVIEDYSDAFLKEVDEADEILENVEEYIEPDSDMYKKTEEKVKEIEENVPIAAWNAANTIKEIEIGEIEIDGDEATAEVVLTTIDGDDFDEKYAEYVISALQNYLDEEGYQYEDGTSILAEEVLSGEVEGAEEIISEFNEYYGDPTDIYEKAAKEAKKVTEDQKVTLKKIDGKWLISEIK